MTGKHRSGQTAHPDPAGNIAGIQVDDLRTESVDLRDIVNAAIETCRPRFEASGHDLILGLPPDPVVLAADAVRLVQVFANVLDGAARYSGPNGTIVVSVEALLREITVRVMDGGLGNAAEFLPHVFDLFSQVDQTNSRRHDDMGIGLKLAKRIVELHQGSVEAFSAGPGLGSTFTVRLPRDA